MTTRSNFLHNLVAFVFWITHAGREWFRTSNQHTHCRRLCVGGSPIELVMFSIVRLKQEMEMEPRNAVVYAGEGAYLSTVWARFLEVTGIDPKKVSTAEC